MLPRSVFRIIILISFLILVGAGQTSSVSAGINSWTGIGPEGGAINALAIDPMTSSTLYAGTAGGVYKSTDSGDNWSAVNNGLRNAYINTLAIDPVTPTTLYAGSL